MCLPFVWVKTQTEVCSQFAEREMLLKYLSAIVSKFNFRWNFSSSVFCKHKQKKQRANVGTLICRL